MLYVLLLVLLNASDAEIPEIVNDGSEREESEEGQFVGMFDMTFMLTRRFRMVLDLSAKPRDVED